MNLNTPDSYKDTMRSLRCCVIIPTYNNQKTLAAVINSVQPYTDDLIVVNDGSTDDTATILKSFPTIELISYSPNKGKGVALRTGLKKATERGFRYAITIDSDGQHFADDIPVFLEKIREQPDSLLVGARNLQQENMPKKNTFGNKFSNFWFRLFTGVNLPDTQSGYRLYPLEKMKGINFYSTRYEFELEAIVRSAWKSIPVLPVQIKVFYAEGEERVSHFRPGPDFTRISVLNTILFFPALLWYRPLLLIKGLKKKSFKEFMTTHFMDPNESTIRKATGVAFGVFMGIIPIWGYQLVTALVLAHFLKLNKMIVGVAANISIPPMIPFLLYGSLKTGQLILNPEMETGTATEEISFEMVKAHLKEYLIGSVVFATGMAIIAGILSFFILRAFEKKQIKAG
jgi:glycosyltransferase involved in cell wall biosynthesis